MHAINNTVLWRFATTYNCNAYGAGSFNSSTSCNSTTPGEQAASSAQSSASNSTTSKIVDTGTHVIAPILLGTLLIIIALLVIRRTAKNSQKS